MSKRELTSRITARVSNDTRVKLEAAAARASIGPMTYVRQAVCEKLERDGFEVLPRLTVEREGGEHADR